MAKQDEGQPRAIPPLKNVQYLNTPVNVTDRDADGNREISFVVGPIEQHSYVLVRPAQVEIARILIAQMENDEKRELLDALAPGIEVAQSVPDSVK